MYNNTIIVNLFASPGSGKSTTAAGVFCELKQKGIDCELVTEFAKDLVWDERYKTFDDQIYLFGKQHHRIFRLKNKVQVVVTDSPFLLGIIYMPKEYQYINNTIYETHKKYNNLNYFIKRVKPYNPNGRNQTEEQSDELHQTIEHMLLNYGEEFACVNGDSDGIIKITDDIINKLKLLENIVN